ncbi:MAG: hypothetical protein EA367_13415 [Leptolyngbya sp. DLM2.Bin15]|nr:MAG: hypothetical protein EA367_13415 [Leptolyngbya sp. DLM2.Bin15]
MEGSVKHQTLPHIVLHLQIMTLHLEPQINIVARHELLAKQAKLSRDAAKRKATTAEAACRKPSEYIFGKHIPALCISGFLTFAGVGASIDAKEPSPALIGGGTSVVLCFISASMDDTRQKREKQQVLVSAIQALQSGEQDLYIAVCSLQQEEEILYCLKELNISREELFSLRDWMADPKSDLRSSMIEVIYQIKSIYPHGKDKRLKSRVSEVLAIEQHYRELKSRLLDQFFQEAAKKIQDQVTRRFQSVSHAKKQEIEKQLELSIQNAKKMGLAVSLPAAVGVGAAGFGVAKKFGADDTANAIVGIGVGLVALWQLGGLVGEISSGLVKSYEQNKRVRDEQSFKSAVAAVQDIQAAMEQASLESNPDSCIQNARGSLEKLKVITKSAVYKEDTLLRSYTALLNDMLKDFIKTSRR